MQQQISDWNKLRDEIHQNSVAHGFWENTPGKEHFLCLVISELMEAVEADRKDRRTNQSLLPHFKDPDKYLSSEKGFNYYFEMYVKDTVEDELADAVIRLLDLAGANAVNMNVSDNPFPMFPDVNSSFTENIFQIVQMLTKDSIPLYETLNVCRMQICKLAESMGVNISWHIQKKMCYNASRDYKHGKLY